MDQQDFQPQEQNYTVETPNAPQNNGKAFSITSLVLGIVAVVLAWFYGINIIALICGIAAIPFSISGKKKAVAAGQPTGLATAGLVLGIIGTVLAAIGFLACTVCVCAVGEAAVVSGAY